MPRLLVLTVLAVGVSMSESRLISIVAMEGGFVTGGDMFGLELEPDVAVVAVVAVLGLGGAAAPWLGVAGIVVAGMVDLVVVELGVAVAIAPVLGVVAVAAALDLSVGCRSSRRDRRRRRNRPETRPHPLPQLRDASSMRLTPQRRLTRLLVPNLP